MVSISSSEGDRAAATTPCYCVDMSGCVSGQHSPGAHVHFHTDRGQDQRDEKAGPCARTVVN